LGGTRAAQGAQEVGFEPFPALAKKLTCPLGVNLLGEAADRPVEDQASGEQADRKHHRPSPEHPSHDRPPGWYRGSRARADGLILERRPRRLQAAAYLMSTVIPRRFGESAKESARCQ